MRFSDQWDELLRTPAWSPIDNVPFETSLVEDVLYQLSDTAFLLAGRRGVDLVPTPEPRVTAVMWATDAGVARRIILRQIEADLCEPACVPPPAILDVPSNYAAISQWCGEGTGRTSLTASYRVATDGKHIISSIRKNELQFMFRSVNPSADEPTIAILIRLIGRASGPTT